MRWAHSSCIHKKGCSRPTAQGVPEKACDGHGIRFIRMSVLHILNSSWSPTLSTKLSPTLSPHAMRMYASVSKMFSCLVQVPFLIPICSDLHNSPALSMMRSGAKTRAAARMCTPKPVSKELVVRSRHSSMHVLLAFMPVLGWRFEEGMLPANTTRSP